MSVETWMKEFAPMPLPTGRVEGLRWSLRKWCGFRAGELLKHDVVFNVGGTITDREGLRYTPGGSNCPQCVQSGGVCSFCPLYMVRGNRCDAVPNSMYAEWTSFANPEPMISLIGKALDAETRIPQPDGTVSVENRPCGVLSEVSGRNAGS